MISVRRARVLPPPSFRFRLATDTLGFGYDLPAARRSRDFHPLERALAGRTMKSPVNSYEFCEFTGDFKFGDGKSLKLVLYYKIISLVFLLGSVMKR